MIADHNDMLIHSKALIWSTTSHASKTRETKTAETDFAILDTINIDQLNDLCDQALEVGTNQKDAAFSTHEPTDNAAM